MSTSSSVVLVLELGTRPRAAIRAGVEFARALDMRVRAVFVESPTMLAACALPQGASIGLGGRALEAIVERERARAQAAFEAEARQAHLSCAFEAVRDETERALEAATRPGDFVVMSIDLSDSRDDRAVSVAITLQTRSIGAMFVPEVAPARRGDVVTSDIGLMADDMISRLALSLSARTVFTAPERDQEAAGDARSNASQEVTAEVQHAALGAPRLFVLAPRHASRSYLSAALGGLRRHRSTLLVLAEAETPTF